MRIAYGQGVFSKRPVTTMGWTYALRIRMTGRSMSLVANRPARTHPHNRGQLTINSERELA